MHAKEKKIKITAGLDIDGTGADRRDRRSMLAQVALSPSPTTLLAELLLQRPSSPAPPSVLL
jgi:hypothetical protein